MKRFTLLLAAFMICGSVFAADPPGRPGASLPPVLNIPQFAPSCPMPYALNTQGVDQAKGEHYCLKANIGCPQGFSGNMDQANGKMICTPNITATCPEGWSGGAVDGKLVCNSIPQPNIPCPKATKDWQWGTTYYKENWNKMGCFANLKPAY